MYTVLENNNNNNNDNNNSDNDNKRLQLVIFLLTALLRYNLHTIKTPILNLQFNNFQ